MYLSFVHQFDLPDAFDLPIQDFKVQRHNNKCVIITETLQCYKITVRFACVKISTWTGD